MISKFVLLVRQSIKDDIDAQGISIRFGEIFKIPRIGSFFLPTVTEISVEADHHADSATVVMDRAVVRCF